MVVSISREELRKRRCYNGGQGTLLKLENISVEDVIINSYLHTDNKIAMELAKRYEYLLILAKTKKNKYLEHRDSIHMNLSKWIKDNKLQREWVDFIYFTQTHFSFKYESIASSYMSEIMESWNYLSGYGENNIYGLSNDNEFLLCPDYYGDWDIKLHKLYKEVEKGKISMERYAHIIKYELNEEFIIERNENLRHIAVFGLIPFINERNKSIYPTEWFPHAIGNYLRFPRVWKSSNFYKEQLKRRKYLIDSKGVKIFLKNAGVFTELLLMETVTRDKKIVMLFRLSTPEGGTYGYYHLQDEYFFSAYKFSDKRDIHDSMENLVLEMYTEVVCGLEKDKKRIYAIKEVEDITNTIKHKSTYLFVQYKLYNENTDKEELKGSRKGSTQKPHERRYAIRKLKENQKASDEAIERALELGIEIQEGFTFVQSYSVGGIKDIRTEI
jgi:hypothetical protein